MVSNYLETILRTPPQPTSAVASDDITTEVLNAHYVCPEEPSSTDKGSPVEDYSTFQE